MNHKIYNEKLRESMTNNRFFSFMSKNYGISETKSNSIGYALKVLLSKGLIGDGSIMAAGGSEKEIRERYFLSRLFVSKYIFAVKNGIKQDNENFNDEFIIAFKPIIGGIIKAMNDAHSWKMPEFKLCSPAMVADFVKDFNKVYDGIGEEKIDAFRERLNQSIRVINSTENV